MMSVNIPVTQHRIVFFWEYRIAAIAGDCKFPGLTAFVGASPTAPTIFGIS